MSFDFCLPREELPSVKLLTKKKNRMLVLGCNLVWKAYDVGKEKKDRGGLATKVAITLLQSIHFQGE